MHTLIYPFFFLLQSFTDKIKLNVDSAGLGSSLSTDASWTVTEGPLWRLNGMHSLDQPECSLHLSQPLFSEPGTKAVAIVPPHPLTTKVVGVLTQENPGPRECSGETKELQI